MNGLSRVIRVGLLGAALPLAGMAGVHAATTMDAALLLKAQKAAPAAAQARVTGESAPMVAATVRFEGEQVLEALAAVGVRIGSVSGNIATADIPLSRLAEVSSLPGVIFIEAARPLQTRLSASVPATGATSLRSGAPLQWQGATGKGVIVGIVDDGFDFRHEDFRNADGTTRLLSLWDMRETAGGTPPSGFAYGRECLPAELNQAISEGPGSTACPQPSTGNHGTHVGGIAAGNGQATGNGQASFRHIGMAPMADIIAANAIGGGVTSSNAVLDAINYIKAKATAAGKPAVVNLSLGSYYGNRDGTSNYEAGISNATGPGFIITAAAGNEGQDPIRAEANLSEGGSVTIGYQIPSDTAQRVQLWYPGTHRWSVSATNGSCATEVVPADTPSYSVETACGTVLVSNNDVNPLNGDREILILFEPTGGGVGPSGTWNITVQSVSGAGVVSMIGAEDANGGTFTSNTSAETLQILTDSCSATEAICVGAYVTRQEWQDRTGQTVTQTAHGEIGAVAGFSSRGPRRNCSEQTRCPMVAKPEILAPGAMIISALGQDVTVSEEEASSVEIDGRRIAYNGTSMATPHVTGAVALLLERNPQLTPADVRLALLRNIQRNALTPADLTAFDPAVPSPANFNVAWGYGIMDVAAAYNALGDGGSTGGTGSITPQVSGDAASGLTVSATIRPAASEAGQTLQAFVVALLPSGDIFLFGNDSWQPFASAGAVPFATFNGSNTLEVPIFSNLVHAGAGLGGIVVFVGYGVDAPSMISQGKFALVHTLTD